MQLLSPYSFAGFRVCSLLIMLAIISERIHSIHVSLGWSTISALRKIIRSLLLMEYILPLVQLQLPYSTLGDQYGSTFHHLLHTLFSFTSLGWRLALL